MERHEQEALARRAALLVAQAAQLLGWVDTEDSARERTPAGAQDRLQVAIGEAPDTPEVRKARGAFRWAQQLWWELARSERAVAAGLAHRYGRSGLLAEEELYREGLIGLYDGARRFDPDRGVRFKTYATWWVRARIFGALGRGRPVRLPTRLQELQLQMNQAQKAAWDQGRELTVWELAALCGARLSDVEAVLQAPTSLSLEITPPNSEQALGQLLVAEGADPEEEAGHNQLLACLRECLSGLEAREAHILKRRLEGASYRDIGDQLGLSHQRVRQITKDALGTLRKRLGARLQWTPGEVLGAL